MTYALQLNRSGPPTLVLEGEFHCQCRTYVDGERLEGVEATFTVVAVDGYLAAMDARFKIGERLFLIALPDARKVPR